jgi:hypothetical protein
LSSDCGATEAGTETMARIDRRRADRSETLTGFCN